MNGGFVNVFGFPVISVGLIEVFLCRFLLQVLGPFDPTHCIVAGAEAWNSPPPHKRVLFMALAPARSISLRFRPAFSPAMTLAKMETLFKLSVTGYLCCRVA